MSPAPLTLSVSIDPDRQTSVPRDPFPFELPGLRIPACADIREAHHVDGRCDRRTERPYYTRRASFSRAQLGDAARAVRTTSVVAANTAEETL